MTMNKVEVLENASNIITGERENQYGTTRTTHAHIAEYWNSYLNQMYETEYQISARDVALMMVLLKIARINGKPTDDTLVDICGYAAIAAELD